MTGITFHPTPGVRDVLMAQIRAIGFGLRRPAVVATALAAFVTVLIASELIGTREAVGVRPARHQLPAMLGVLFPISVWQGEARFGAGFLWTLPVDRRWHALARAFAGWVWLMAAVALYSVWLGAFGRMPELLLALVPFTAATAPYVLASALALATPHPVRWIAGVVLGFLLLLAVEDAANAPWLINEPALFDWLTEGPYGVNALLTAKTGALGEWAIATVCWTGAGVVALAAAASRHRESR